MGLASMTAIGPEIYILGKSYGIIDGPFLYPMVVCGLRRSSTVASYPDIYYISRFN
jgi:hypothetical protein